MTRFLTDPDCQAPVVYLEGSFRRWWCSVARSRMPKWVSWFHFTRIISSKLQKHLEGVGSLLIVLSIPENPSLSTQTLIGHPIGTTLMLHWNTDSIYSYFAIQAIHKVFWSPFCADSSRQSLEEGRHSETGPENQRSKLHSTHRWDLLWFRVEGRILLTHHGHSPWTCYLYERLFEEVTAFLMSLILVV